MIKTSKENREIVARLSRKLGLGSENHISRIAFSIQHPHLICFLFAGGKELACATMEPTRKSILD